MRNYQSILHRQNDMKKNLKRILMNGKQQCKIWHEHAEVIAMKWKEMRVTNNQKNIYKPKTIYEKHKQT